MDDSEQLPAAAPPQAQSVGTLLKQARLARDLTLEQVSTELRIETRQLDALEQDRFERIGVPVFVKGYLRQYAALLGLVARDLLALYDKQTSLQEVLVQPSKTIKLHDERQITVWVVAAVILAVIVVALAAWLWNGGEFRIGTVTPATQTSTEPAAAPAAAVPVTPGGTVAGRPANAPAAVPLIPTGEARSEPPAAKPAADPVVAPAASSAARDAADAQSPAGDDRGGLSVTAALAVTFEQDSWAEISDARGERLFYGLGAAGRSAKLSGAPPFAVVLGNSAGVKIEVDGEDFPVPTDGKPGDYSRFSIDIAGD